MASPRQDGEATCLCCAATCLLCQPPSHTLESLQKPRLCSVAPSSHTQLPHLHTPIPRGPSHRDFTQDLLVCQQVILMAGLQGVGKTTACGKLATLLKKQNRKVLLVATDVYRPAAIEQLRLLGKKAAVSVFDLGTDAKPVDIAKQALEKARAEDFDTIIVDTAGRLQVRMHLISTELIFGLLCMLGRKFLGHVWKGLAFAMVRLSM